MVLLKAVPDATMPIDGYERRTLQCAQCGEVEERLAFNRREQSPSDDPHPAKPEQSQVAEARPPSTSIWTRAVETLRNRQRTLGQEEKSVNREQQFRQAWDGVEQTERPRSRLFNTTSSLPSVRRDEQAQRASPSSAWARAVAKLGRLQDKTGK